ncbi:hypothetical protein K437DRAFT_86128 [Tilletiaria anomala UBC 951]|uniref:Uncharacterized protein n=1 Tax=Tilletiaria anomala (strain ATCC 24038 / CBS 436.72 / UBC 951) TaxID=1037660 RepID=A0A066W3D3_TILAU|nr:uncharacterized protein K437DRAFT_86128 [Tilletiaria anomala UBC 951]KDN48457.1 hypothetical protein K437DRAFT_86128 [Tilletiaria anomala UBC 951]
MVWHGAGTRQVDDGLDAVLVQSLREPNPVKLVQFARHTRASRPLYEASRRMLAFPTRLRLPRFASGPVECRNSYCHFVCGRRCDGDRGVCQTKQHVLACQTALESWKLLTGQKAAGGRADISKKAWPGAGGRMDHPRVSTTPHSSLRITRSKRINCCCNSALQCLFACSDACGLCAWFSTWVIASACTFSHLA